MWIEGLALVGGFATYLAVTIVYFHLKGLITGGHRHDVERSWTVVSYVTIVVVACFALQPEPNRSPAPEDELAGQPYDEMDQLQRDFLR